MSQVAGYIVCFTDEDYEAIFPAADAVPRAIYRSREDAEAALQQWVKSFETFKPVLYGEAFPYDKTTAAKELETKGRALYGWVSLEDEDGDELRYGLCIVSIVWG